eukprot:CAMPEP_0185612746 /NCGR_PEP_ID=MMETSP0436-20130131/23347_1 /TAXON_ID=626734 ORGANISM="Favella taraikaensis, Strain Fe Narragansett Bay" /NCGR_SAMPLE_ID=MMETSP0436 /ASSEMBLY_ACC=CAM_ASM_000390 /LENGTH=103 /DNA_ID=CAMNT_0028246369 /DNA_START=342 /DNA_END=653 /DNA_ORIENTATION=+
MVHCSHHIEIVIEVGDDEHYDEVRDDIKLSLAVGEQDVNVGHLDEQADGHLGDASHEGQLVVSELPGVVQRVLHHVEGLLELALHNNVHDHHRDDTRDTEFDL